MIDGYPLRGLNDIPDVNYNIGFEESLVTFANKPLLVKQFKNFKKNDLLLSHRYRWIFIFYRLAVSRSREIVKLINI